LKRLSVQNSRQPKDSHSRSRKSKQEPRRSRFLYTFASELGRVSVTLTVAEFFAILDENDTALDWLARAVRNGDERVNWFRKDPRLASIRNDPNFQRIIDSIESRRKQR